MGGLDWLTWACIGVLLVLIIGFPLGWQIRIIRNRNTNLKKSIGKIWGTFFNPATGGEENYLCSIRDTFKVIPPNVDKHFKGQGESNGYYLLVPFELKLDAETGRIIPPTGVQAKLTTRDLWPPGRRISEQVPIERGYWVMGDSRIKNPWNDFVPVNTSKIVEILADQRSAEALAAHLRYEMETVERVGEQVEAIAKNIKWVWIGLMLLAVVTLGSVISSIMTYMGMGDIEAMLKGIGIQ